MGSLPGWLMRHRVALEPYQGSGAYGPVYGPRQEVRCFLDMQTKLTRDPGGNEVASSSTFYAAPGLTCPPQSRVTLPDGRVTTVIAALPRDGGGLATPDHTEVQLA